MTEKVARGEAPLSRKYTNLKFETARLHRLPAPDPRELREKERLKKVRVGIIRAFPQPLDALGDSTVYQVAEGRLYVLRAISEGAVQLRLRFGHMALPDGARLFVYSAKNPDEFYGPYQGRGPNGDGTFWTPPISGDEVVVEYLLPNAPTGSSQATSPFRVSEVSHIFADPGIQTGRHRLASGGCNLDVPPEWSEAAKSVGLLQFTDQGGEFLCSGTLLNTTNNSGAPYVLTANHCIGDLRTARTLRVYWLYTAGARPPATASNYGSTLLATAEANDFTFLQLDTPVPAGVRFSGWTTTMPTPDTPVTGIHHPQGDYQRVAFGQVVNETCPAEFIGELCDNFIKLRWSSGIVEPGSSGSGLWTGPASDPKLVGTLTGGSSSCENPTGVDFYGRFDLAFEAISYYLTGQGCAYSLSRRRQAASAAGGSGQVEVTSMENDGCAWTARSDVPWITFTSSSSGSGDGALSYAMAPNPATNRRIGILSIAGQTLIVVQAGTNGTCAATEIALGQTVGGNLSSNNCESLFGLGTRNNRYTFTATAGQAIAIALNSSEFDTYLTLIGPDGALIAENDDNPPGTNSRIPIGQSYNNNFITLLSSGTYTIEVSPYDAEESGGYTLTLEKSCVYSLSPRKLMVSGTGRQFFGANAVELTASEDRSCAYNTASDVNWIGSLYSGVGSGRRFPEVASNPGSKPRAGFFYLAGIPVLVRQLPMCGSDNRPSITPAAQRFSGAELNGKVKVTMAAGAYCTWEYRYNSDPAPWIFFNYQPTFEGTGDGEVVYTVGQHIGIQPRTTTMQVAGQAHTITQDPVGGHCPPIPIAVGQTVNGAWAAGDCKWSLEPDSYADHYTFTGIAGQQIAYKLSSPETPVTFLLYDQAGNYLFSDSSFGADNQVRSPSKGYYDLSNGTYTLVVLSKTVRLGSYTLSLETVGGPGCVYSIPPMPEQIFEASGGQGSVSLSATGNCEWTIKSDAAWITFPESASGSGSKNITYSLAPNTGPERYAEVIAAGRSFFVVQKAPCSYVKITPATMKLYGKWTGDQGASVTVETGRGCPLTATSKTPWITVSRIASPYITFRLERNDGSARTGTVEVMGQTMEIQQGGGNLAVVSAANYSQVVAPGSIVSIFGSGMSVQTDAATSLPLPIYLAETFVDIGYGVANTSASLLYVSPTQINILLPPDLPPGIATVDVFDLSISLSSRGQFRVERVAPGLFTADATGNGLPAAAIVRVKADNTQIYETVGQFDPAQNRYIATPIDLNDPSEQVFLLLFGTGIRGRSAPSAVTAEIGGEEAEVWYAGAQGGFAGLDQVNLLLPRSLRGRGEVPITLTVDGVKANIVTITIAGEK